MVQAFTGAHFRNGDYSSAEMRKSSGLGAFIEELLEDLELIRVYIASEQFVYGRMVMVSIRSLYRLTERTYLCLFIAFPSAGC